MRLTSLFFQTFKETSAEAEMPSHILMLKAGLIKKLASGVYSFLPLGWRVIKKIENIIREEIDSIGAQEIFMPVLHPAELWQETGRWEIYKKENILFITTDRKGSQYLLGPTHEEVVTDIVRGKIKSYKDLPVSLYQIQTKFRDEIRPRFGISRAREFMMKDAYSFDENFDKMNESYNLFFEAYKKIFNRCGLRFAIVEAFSGAIGGDVSHEFMAIADVGEDFIISCSNCGYSANVEKASSVSAKTFDTTSSEIKPLEIIYTPRVKTIDELVKFTNIESENMVKTLFYKADEQLIAILVKGDREVNEMKLKGIFRISNLEMASEEDIKKVTSAEIGFAGPVGLKEILIIMDEGIRNMANFLSGANKTDYHYKNININRDFKPTVIADVKFAKEEDDCPKCKNKLTISKGIELGHTFKLGEKYSKSMSAAFVNRKGEMEFAKMGCYGIGTGRIMVSAIEQNYDKEGIVWPYAIAPYSIIIIPTNTASSEIVETADKLYIELRDLKYEVLYDDRDASAGIKFKDADLIGIPLKVIVGKNLKDGKIEIKYRKDSKSVFVEKDKVQDELLKIITELQTIIKIRVCPL